MGGCDPRTRYPYVNMQIQALLRKGIPKKSLKGNWKSINLVFILLIYFGGWFSVPI